ncbi:MAG: hypothetical protein ACLS9X_02065, partial [Faecalibacterium sp.]
QRDTGVLVACDMCFHKKTSFQGGLQIHYSITQIRKKWNAGGAVLPGEVSENFEQRQQKLEEITRQISVQVKIVCRK